MGCLFRMIGIAVLVAVLLVAGWIYRDDIRRWVGRGSPATAVATEPAWEPLTTAGAARARAIVARLEKRSGRVYENVRPADLSALVFEELSKQALPPSARDAEATVMGDRLYIRANVKLSDFGGRDALGALGRLLGDREQVQFGGSLGVVRPGLAQYRVEALRIGNLDVPPPLIPKLVRRIDASARPEGLAANALPLEIPAYIADVRIGEGTVTLIKAAR
jgi:hypothetical protein